MKTFKLFILGLLLAAPASAGVVAVYHTSDAHGWYSARPALWDKENSTRPIGGFPVLAALLKKETTPYLLLDSGDMFQGTPEGILTKGLASAQLMNQLGYAAAVPGNHDFDYGEKVLKAVISSATFAMLGANLYVKETGANTDYLKPYIMLERNGRKIAVLGLLGEHTATATLPANVAHLRFANEAAAAAHWLPEIKKLNPDAVIVIAHLGLSEELSIRRLDISTWTFKEAPAGTLQIARAAPGIDLLLGGHNHTALLKGYQDPVSKTVFGESGYGLSYVTRAELSFDDKTGRLTGVKAALVPLWAEEIGEDPAVLKTVAGFNSQVEREMGQLVGEAATPLGFSPEGLDSGIGNWFCDLFREATGAQLAFNNTKAIRAEIQKGPVRLRDIYQTMPFDNTIVTARLTGQQVLRLLSDNLREPMSFIQLSGLEVAYVPGPNGRPERISAKYQGKEIEPDQEFTVATNNYLAMGGNGGDAFAEARDLTDTMLPVREAMIKSFTAGPVSAPPVGRIKRLK